MENLIVVYDRRSAQAATEWINAHSSEGVKPVSFNEVCKVVEDIAVKALRGEEYEETFRGVFFRFNWEGGEEITCDILIPASTREPVNYAIDLSPILKEVMDGFIAELEDFLGVAVDEQSDSTTSPKDKRKLH